MFRSTQRSARMFRPFPTRWMPLIALTLLLLAPLAAEGQTVFGPKAEWLGETTHAFGEITRGDSISVSFAVKNAGTQPLVIERAKPPCTCTHAYFDARPIPAGQTREVTIGFASKDSQGEVYKEVLIFTNEAETPPHKLVLEGTVLPADEPVE